MTGPLKDLKYKHFGSLYVIEYDGRGDWTCLCECGRKTHVRGTVLRSGRVKSCGCMKNRRKKLFHGCDEDCFNCIYPDCYKPQYLMRGGRLPDGIKK